jgi:hypothetical protein
VTILVIVVAVWLAVAAVTLVGMSLLGRAGRLADEASDDDAARVKAWQEGVALGVVAPHPFEADEAAVCAPCAAKVPGAVVGEPCPDCGNPVMESPRIITPRHRVDAAHGTRRTG